MSISIKKCLNERTQYPMREKGDALLDYYLDNYDPCCFIVPDHLLWDDTFRLFFETHNVAGLFCLGKAMLNVLNNFTLVCSSKESTDDIFIGQYDGSTKENLIKRLMPSVGELLLPNCYNYEYEEYLLKIETWINDRQMPVDSDLCTFNIIKREDIKPGYYNAFYYGKSAIRSREIIENELIVKLQDVADILIPELMPEGGYVVKLSTKRYPFRYSDQDKSSKTNIQLKRGDIVVPRKWFDKAYLLDEEPEHPLYATSLDVVIRCKKILPEYLYLYLNSNVARSLITACEGTFLKPLEKEDLENIPIIVPRLGDDVYIDDFKILTSEKREYGKQGVKKELINYYRNIHNAEYPIDKANTIEEILNVELAKRIRARNRKLIQPILSEDIKELNICYNGGAYKATLILAGSIMEAILIDWLSEIDHKNYFTQDYMVNVNNRMKRGDLIDYINAIKEIKRPEWMVEAEHAHSIRKKRNLVHAKLCLKEDVDIDDDTCKEVIEYLKQIIRSRGLI